MPQHNQSTFARSTPNSLRLEQTLIRIRKRAYCSATKTRRHPQAHPRNHAPRSGAAAASARFSSSVRPSATGRAMMHSRRTDLARGDKGKAPPGDGGPFCVCQCGQSAAISSRYFRASRTSSSKSARCSDCARRGTLARGSPAQRQPQPHTHPRRLAKLRGDRNRICRVEWQISRAEAQDLPQDLPEPCFSRPPASRGCIWIHFGLKRLEVNKTLIP